MTETLTETMSKTVLRLWTQERISTVTRTSLITIVGTKLHGPTFDESYEEESEEVSPGTLESLEASDLIYYLFKPVSYVWPHQKVPNILWMNEPTHKDFAHAGLAVSAQPFTIEYRNEVR